MRRRQVSLASDHIAASDDGARIGPLGIPEPWRAVPFFRIPETRAAATQQTRKCQQRSGTHRPGIACNVKAGPPHGGGL